MQTGRPLFATMWKHFNTVYGDGSLANVSATIGCKVETNIRLGATNPALGFTSGCAIRMSYMPEPLRRLHHQRRMEDRLRQGWTPIDLPGPGPSKVPLAALRKP